MVQKNTAILLIIFAVLLVALVVFQRQPEDREELPTPGPDFGLFDFELVDVQQITVRNIDGVQIVFEQTETGWAGIEPKLGEGEVDQVRAASVLGQLVNLNRVDVPSIDVSPNALGLQNPPHTIEILLENGSNATLSIGDVSPTGTGYYARLDQSSPLLVTKTTVDQALGLIDLPPILPTPVPAAPETQE